MDTHLVHRRTGPRLYHKKSRLGCMRCKARRVKVRTPRTERGGPRFRGCAVRMLNWPTNTSSVTRSVLRAPDAVGILSSASTQPQTALELTARYRCVSAATTATMDRVLGVGRHGAAAGQQQQQQQQHQHHQILKATTRPPLAKPHPLRPTTIAFSSAATRMLPPTRPTTTTWTAPLIRPSPVPGA